MNSSSKKKLAAPVVENLCEIEKALITREEFTKTGLGRVKFPYIDS